MYRHDQRTVMTLDAGGTNFVFSAIRGNQNIVETICLPAVSDNLNGCLTVLKKGFSAVKRQLENEPVAISFAFPGPADYKNGEEMKHGNPMAMRPTLIGWKPSTSLR